MSAHTKKKIMADLAPGKRTPPLASKIRAYLHNDIKLPLTIFLLGLGLAAAAALFLRHDINEHAELEFKQVTQRVTTEIEQRYRQPIYGLDGLKSLYAAHPKVKRAEFRAAVEAHNLPQEFPGVRSLGFIEQVTRANLDTFVAAERADGAPQFASRQLIDKE